MIIRSLRIGGLATRTGCSIETIRYYERIGLLPKPLRSDGGYRLYEEEHVERLYFICRARDLGFHLADIMELLELGSDGPKVCAQAREVAARHLGEVRSRIAELHAIEATLEQAVQRCDTNGEARCPVVTTLLSGGNPAVAPAAGCPG